MAEAPRHHLRPRRAPREWVDDFSFADQNVRRAIGTQREGRGARDGAGAIEGPEEAYGPKYYAVFFTDPDGNPLEVCSIG